MSKKEKTEPRYFGTEAPVKDPEGEKVEVKIGKQILVLSHLNKVFFPKDGYTKKDLIDYYRDMAPVLLPYLKDRPESLLRYPDGITGEHFFHKDLEMAPEWIKKVKVRKESEDRDVHYMLCNDEAALVYMINLGCIDLNPWASRVGHLENPDYLVMDLDPEGVDFSDVVEVARVTHEVMDNAGMENFCKTTGIVGMHIFSPTGGKYTYDQVRDLCQLLAIEINKKLPRITSLERSPEDRKHKVYLDCFQNAKGQTIASVYSIRGVAGAQVSAPLKWEEVNKKLHPSQFTIKNMRQRVEKIGDIFKPVLEKGFDMKKVLESFDR